MRSCFALFKNQMHPKEEGRKKEESRRKKEEGRRKKEEGRRKKEEGRRKLFRDSYFMFN
jgi:hypothetical protein